MAEDLSITIQAAASEPLKVSVDGNTVEQRSIEELIRADQYAKASDASRAGPSRGILYTRLVPPGAA
jgi:hypothetical protein